MTLDPILGAATELDWSYGNPWIVSTGLTGSNKGLDEDSGREGQALPPLRTGGELVTPASRAPCRRRAS